MHRVRLTFVLGFSILTACRAPKPTAKPETAGGTPRPPTDGVSMIDTDTPGLTFKLREGQVVGERERIPVAPAQPLGDAEAQKIFTRLPALVGQGGDEKDGALREKSLPAPRTGQTVTTPFPPPSSENAPEAIATGPLEVTRSMPEGDVPLAPHVSVTFNQPMVPITSLAELEKLPSPVKLTPQPPGRWRWVGTKTLLFEPKSGESESGDVTPGSFPMATEYLVEIPAGTRSQSGGTLAKAVSFKFRTPPPQAVVMVPQEGPTRRDPLLFVSFDQKVDPAAALAAIKVKAGDRTVGLRLATADELTGDEGIQSLAQGARPGRWLAFRAADLLPADAYVSVQIGPGTPSAEGPLLTTATQTFAFRTYGPLRVRWQNCGTKKDGCSPFSAWNVSLSNPIDVAKFDKSMVKVTPEPAGMKVSAFGDTLNIVGRAKGNRSYKVTLAATIPDQFGQTLAKETTLDFVLGSAPPALFSTAGDFVVLDPAVGTRFSIFSVNHKAVRLKIFEAGPETWDAFGKYRREVFHRETFSPDPPGRKLVDETLAIKGEPDELTETRIDLAKALGKALGNVLVWVEPTSRPKNRWEWRPILVWAQVTQIGLDALVDGDEMVAWATSLADGKPLPGVALEITGMGAKATTGEGGVARIPLGDGKGGRLLLARKGNDLAVLPENISWWNEHGGWQKSGSPEVLRWYLATDRNMYKPSEEVRVKGWIRRITPGELGDVAGFAGEGTTVTYQVMDSRGNEITTGSAKPNALGGFDLSFKLPPTMNLGSASVRLISDRGGAGAQTAVGFEVQEFRRPEFEVSAQADAGPHFLGGRANVAVEAKYYAGGGLANAETVWNVSTSPGYFSPPNRQDWMFGIQPSWWDDYGARPTRSRGRGRSHVRHPGPADPGESKYEEYKAVTDSAGKHQLRIDFLAVNPPRPTSVVAQATVMDVNRQAWTASANLLVHPGNLYVGLKSDRVFVEQGGSIKVDAIVTDLDGKAVPGKAITVTSVRLDWEQVNGEMELREVDLKECKLTSTADAQRCTFVPAEGGMYRIVATVADERGRPNLTQFSLWVAGGKLPAAREVKQEQVRLVLDKKQYQPGETAEVLVIAPWGPAHGLLTLQRSGIFRVEPFTTDASGHKTLRVKIEEGWTPNAVVKVDVVGSAPRTNDAGDVDEKLPRRPAFASGEAILLVESPARKLALLARPRARALEPGGQTIVDVTLKDAKGEPVANGEVAVIVVDEAILALTGYALPDPTGVFYTTRGGDTRAQHLRQAIVLANPLDAAGGTEGAGMDMNGRIPAMESGAMPPSPAPMKTTSRMANSVRETAEPTAQAPAIKLRTDFNALAVFAPAVRTDAKGKAEVQVKLPDNLTRYRVMAVAVAGENRFGKFESTITARLPLMVRPSPPRFLNFGDELELPVVLRNQTDQPMQVQVAVRSTNAELTAGNARQVTVPANDRVEVRFPAAARKAGIARFQFGAVSGKWTDAAQVELPVWTPATTEAFATYGVVDKGAIAQPVAMPGGVFPQFGGLEITTSSTALQALTDAVLYLVRYPYECSEQMASRILAIASLRDVLTAFQAAGLPSPEKMLESVAKDVEMLRRLQNGDGGWGFWKRGERSWPFLTAHVAHALARAKAKGFAVPQAMIDRAFPYLRQIESHIPSEWGPEVRRALIAYALYVRLQLGERDAPKARAILAEAGGPPKMGLETVGWIYPVLSGDQGSGSELAAIRKHLASRVEETAAAAHFVTSYGDGGYLLLQSDRRADGLLLEGLIKDQPSSDLIPKLVQGLLAHRTAGRWANTQESAWVLLALDLYFRTFEKVTPDFVARVWLGAQYAGEHKFKGRTTERHFVGIPMRWLAELKGGKADLVLGKEGPGRMYYRVGMQYAPTDLTMPPRDSGFTVERVYESVDDAKDVRRDADGTWRVRAGARVRVRLTMVAQARRHHVALVDPLPAGLEPLNAALAVTGALPLDKKAGGPQGGPGGGRYWWWGPWYEHENLRDERVEAFTSLLWEGVHTYTYVARATTPGKFVVPPTKAEEMYHPETFGRAAGDKLVVE